MTGRPISEDDLHAYVDGALDTVRRADVEAYLADHPDVARRVDGYRARHDALRSSLLPLAREPVPPSLDLGRLVERRRRSMALRWQAAAAVLLVVAGGAVGWSVRASTEPASTGLPALAQEASTAYAVFEPDRLHPVEIRASEGPQLTDWIARRTGHAMNLPDLSRTGYRLMGGRVVATPHGPAGMLMYDDDRGTRLVLLTRPMEAGSDVALSEYRRGALSGLAWERRGVGFVLVGAVPASSLLPVADEAKRQVDAT